MVFDSKAEIARLNAVFRSEKNGATIEQIGDRLYIRGTFPPKPRDARREPYFQRIALGIYANASGVKRAKEEVKRISSDLAMGRFSWDAYLKKTLSNQTVADWVKELEKQYFQQRKRSPKTQTTWDKDYATSLKKLPQEKALTVAVLLEAIAKTDPDTKTRKRVCMAFSRLAKLAGIELDVTQLKGNYSPSGVQSRDLPSDALILEWRDRIEDPAWQWVYGMMATYGLRNHEVFLIDVESLRDAPGALTVLDGKTGGRRVYPCPAEWWQKWELWKVQQPAVTGKNHSALGKRVTQYFSRHETPFPPYALRHCWAVRTAVMGLDPSISAKMMGHNLLVHNRTYHRFLNESHLQTAWEAVQRPKNE